MILILIQILIQEIIQILDIDAFLPLRGIKYWSETANSAYDKCHNITHTNIKDYIGHFISDINTYKAYIKDNN